METMRHNSAPEKDYTAPEATFDDMKDWETPDGKPFFVDRTAEEDKPKTPVRRFGKPVVIRGATRASELVAADPETSSELELVTDVGAMAVESVVTPPEDIEPSVEPMSLTPRTTVDKLDKEASAEKLEEVPVEKWGATAVSAAGVELRPVISPSRVLDTKAPIAEKTVDKDLIDKLTSGKIAQVGTKVAGMRQLRDDRKHIIAVQRKKIDASVDAARDGVHSARSERLKTWAENGVLARGGKRMARREELKSKAFEAIDKMDTSSLRKSLMRLQARKNARSIARQQIRQETDVEFNKARTKHLSSKMELRRQKERHKDVRFSPIRRRKTLGGASAGFVETWKAAGADLNKTDKQRDIELQKRYEALKARQEKVLAAKKRREAKKP